MPIVSSSTLGLSPALIEQYHREGFLILRDVFSADEVSALAAETETLLARSDLIHSDNIRCRWSNDEQTDACHFDCFDPVIDIGPVCRYFALSEKILAPRGLPRRGQFSFR